jgi:carbon monoxide dehydrogenase subunit G
VIAPLAHVEADVAAPVEALWAVLTDFAHPQRLAPSIAECTVEGWGVGAVRCVFSSRGLVIYERLVECDAATHRFVYEVLDRGDMPFAGVTAYRAGVALTELGGGMTRVSWMAEGNVDGPRGEVVAFLRELYGQAIRNLADVALGEGQPA